MLVNRDAEEVTIGLLLRNPQEFYEVSEIIAPGAFSVPLLADVFAAVGSLVREGRAVESALIAPQVKVKPEGVTLSVYLAKLKAEAPSEGVAAADFAEAVLEAHSRRQAIALAQDLQKAATTHAELEDALGKAQIGLAELLATRQPPSQSIGAVSAGLMDRLRAAKTAGSSLGIFSGLRAYDELVGPMMPEDLVILGGATSMGKTALGLQIVLQLAMNGTPAAVISQEMSVEQLTARALSRLSGVPSHLIESEDLNADELDRVCAADATLRRLPIKLDALRRPTVAAVEARVARLKRDNGIRIVLVDHFQYLSPPGRVRDRFEGFALIADALKAAAKQTGIPWLVISHLGRDLHKRDDHRPKIADLFGASEIEKAADAILFVHREQYFLEMEEPAANSNTHQDWQNRLDRVRGRAELILAKRRRGKGRGVRECLFNAATTTFEDT